MKRIKYILIITIFFSCQNLLAQGLHTNSARAAKLYTEASENFDFFNFDSAEKLFLQALALDPRFFEARLQLGDLYFKMKRFREAMINYRVAYEIDSMAYQPVLYNLATSELMESDYESALLHFRSYLKVKSASEKNKVMANRQIANCLFAIEAMKKPVLFNPVALGNGVNSTDDEYWPSLTADGSTMMFTRQVYSNQYPASLSSTQEDFYISTLDNGVWKPAYNAGAPVNTKQNEGAQTISSAGNYMYFTSCDRSGGLGSCDLYFSAFRSNGWSTPYNLGPPVNTTAWESTPSISADGTRLFFSSSRPGGEGGKDLWYTIMGPNGQWTQPINLGKSINTPYDEMSPFIHFDGKTLYFASDGRPGMGGLDIYITRMINDTTWSEPQNLGYPVNTSSDDMGLVIESDGEKAYFSSLRNKPGGKDIFWFTLEESVRPNPVSYLKGKVTDKATGKLLTAEFELINLSTNRVEVKSTTDETGNFLVCLPSGNNYGLNVARPGYLFYSENFMFEGDHDAREPLIKRIALNPIKAGEKMILSNVFYEIDSWELKKESVEELNNLSDLLKANNGLIVEIGGYTDSTGTDQYNLTLSEKRAVSVVNYLVKTGIASPRLKYRGYGNTSPVGNNVTTEGRRLNRRTEVMVIESD